MKRRLLAMAALVASLLLPAAAEAANAYATGNVNMRAGPGTAYPKITTVQRGDAIDVYGCVAGWSWCDVGWRGARGWVSGNYIEMIYAQQRVELPRYAPRIGVPVITFGIESYWDRWYVNRPFYRERERWYRSPRWDDRPQRPPVYYDDYRPRPRNPGGDDLRRPGVPDRGQWRDDRRREDWRDDRRRDDRRVEERRRDDRRIEERRRDDRRRDDSRRDDDNRGPNFGIGGTGMRDPSGANERRDRDCRQPGARNDPRCN